MAERLGHIALDRVATFKRRKRGGGRHSQGLKFLTQFVQNRGGDTVPEP